MGREGMKPLVITGAALAALTVIGCTDKKDTGSLDTARDPAESYKATVDVSSQIAAAMNAGESNPYARRDIESIEGPWTHAEYIADHIRDRVLKYKVGDYEVQLARDFSDNSLQCLVVGSDLVGMGVDWGPVNGRIDDHEPVSFGGPDFTKSNEFGVVVRQSAEDPKGRPFLAATDLSEVKDSHEVFNKLYQRALEHFYEELKAEAGTPEDIAKRKADVESILMSRMERKSLERGDIVEVERTHTGRIDRVKIFDGEKVVTVDIVMTSLGDGTGAVDIEVTGDRIGAKKSTGKKVDFKEK